MPSKLKNLIYTDSFIRLFKNASWLLGEKILRMLVGLFVGVWVARYLGPDRFGLFNYAQSFVALFTIIASLGLDGVVVRELVNGEKRKDDLIGTVFWLKLMGAFVVLLLLAVAVNFTSHDHEVNVIVFIIASATIFQSFNVVDMYFQSKVMGKYIVFANVSTLLISSVVKIALMAYNAELIFFAWAVLFDSIILAMGYIYFYRNHLTHSVSNNKSSLALKFNKCIALSLLNESWPLMLSGAASIINMRIDQVLLGSMTNFSTVGNYAVAVRISEIWFVLPGIIGTSIYPSIISAKKRGIEIYRMRVIAIIKYMSIFAIPFALLVSLLSNIVTSALYGDKYDDAGRYLAFHIWSGVPYLIFFVYSQVVVIEKLTKLTFYISFYAVFVNLLLNYIFIPIYGGVGAATVTLVVAWTSVLATIFLVEIKTDTLKIWGNK